MRRAIRSTLLPALLVLMPVHGAADQSSRIGPPFAGTCEVGFDGTSTLHGFAGEAAPSRFVLVAASDGGGLDADVVVDARSLRTGLAARDARLRTMLDVDRWPDIVGRFRRVDPAVVEATRRLPFTLTIRDVSRPVDAVVTRWARGERDLVLEAEATLSLRDFGLEAPSVVGLVRVGDVVRVRVRASVVAGEPAA